MSNMYQYFILSHQYLQTCFYHIMLRPNRVHMTYICYSSSFLCCDYACVTHEQAMLCTHLAQRNNRDEKMQGIQSTHLTYTHLYRSDRFHGEKHWTKNESDENTSNIIFTSCDFVLTRKALVLPGWSKSCMADAM